jgi:hypothetical protein
VRELLQRAGFKVHGHRATCIHCAGRDQQTVSFTTEVAFCHRCKWTANATQLARAQGRALPPRKLGLAARRKRQFFDWLDRRYRQLADFDYNTARKAQLAKAVLVHFSDCELAWAALASRYHAEHALTVFFEAASDKIGRFELYRAWRQANV